jgi:hypothetical protein
MEHRVLFQDAVIADVFAVWPFRLDQPARVEITFKHEFGVGRHEHVDSLAFDDRHRLAAHRARDMQFIHRWRRRHCSQKIRRMRADCECDGQFLAAADCSEIDRPQIRRRIEIDAGGARPAQHQPAAADIGPAIGGILRIINTRRNVEAAIKFMLQVHRQ